MTRQYGWAGKILRVNLTTGAFSTVDTNKYTPKYVGGLGIAHKIWWDEVKPGVKAFDPENKLIFMNGPAAGSISPSGGRGEFLSVSPHSYPEQYTNTGIGGALPTHLKWCGYDGIIFEGKAPEPCYLLVTGKGPELRSAKHLWGMGLVDAQKVLRAEHGDDAATYGIGPAGENLVRFAIIGSGMHGATGQGGFGAIMGSKNLKAIVALKGSHQVGVANVEKAIKTIKKFRPNREAIPLVDSNLHDNQSNPFWKNWVGPNERPNFSINWMGHMYNKPYKFLSHSCTIGCLYACGFYEFRNVPAVTTPKLLDVRTGCNFTRYEQFFHREANEGHRNFASGLEVHELATNLGFGHFEIVYGIVPWLYYTKALGIDTEALVGMPTDVRSIEWWKKLLTMIAYRQGFGEQLAEGLKRTVVKLGEDKYAHPIYEGPEAARGESWLKQRIPIAALGGWGYVTRSLGTEMPFPMNLPSMLNWLIDTRDPHHSKWPDWAHKEFAAWIQSGKHYDSDFPLEWAKQSTIRGTLLDCLPACFMFPLRKYMGWQFSVDDVGEGTESTAVESRMFSDITGVELSEEEFYKSGERINALFRAIQIRNHNRNAQMEWDAVVPQYYDFVDQTKLKVTVGNFYEYLGWDRETGWPTRETYESLDLKEVADALEAEGKLPVK